MRYKTDTDAPSEMFINAMCEGGVGNDELECGWCGRLHLCPDNEYTGRDDEEHKDFKEYCENEHKKNPEGVILHYGYNSVSAKELNNILFVECCPCNGLSRFEKFIWNNRNTVRNYLKVRTEQEYEWAQQELTRNKLAGI
jgi:hypothetical protein